MRIDDRDLAARLFDLNELAARNGSLQSSAQLVNRRLDDRLRPVA